MLSDEWIEGSIAAELGRFMCDCPYTWVGTQRSEWMKGFTYTKREIEELKDE